MYVTTWVWVDLYNGSVGIVVYSLDVMDVIGGRFSAGAGHEAMSLDAASMSPFRRH